MFKAADRIKKLEEENGVLFVANVRLNSRADLDCDHYRDRSEKMEVARDGAYTERNRLVALLACLFPSGVKRTAIPGWDEAWHGCVYIDLPTGQASWHFHDSEKHLFAHLPPYDGEWDGHTTEEKYERLVLASSHAKQNDRIEKLEKALHEAAAVADNWGNNSIATICREALKDGLGETPASD